MIKSVKLIKKINNKKVNEILVLGIRQKVRFNCLIKT